MQRRGVQSLGQEGPPEEEMATHSSILAGRIPWTEVPGGLQSMGCRRVGYDLATKPQHQAGSLGVYRGERRLTLSKSCTWSRWHFLNRCTWTCGARPSVLWKAWRCSSTPHQTCGLALRLWSYSGGSTWTPTCRFHPHRLHFCGNRRLQAFPGGPHSRHPAFLAVLNQNSWPGPGKRWHHAIYHQIQMLMFLRVASLHSESQFHSLCVILRGSCKMYFCFRVQSGFFLPETKAFVSPLSLLQIEMR